MQTTKSTALDPKLPFAQLVEKIHHEDIIRTHLDRHKLNTNSTLSSSINNFSLDIDRLTVNDIHMMEEDIALGTNVVRHKYSNDTNFKSKPLFLKFCRKCSRSGHSISLVLTKHKQNHLKNVQKQIFNQAMKGNRNLPNKQVKSNNMTGKPLSFSYRSRSKSRDRLDNSRHRSPN